MFVLVHARRAMLVMRVNHHGSVFTSFAWLTPFVDLIAPELFLPYSTSP